MSHIEGADDGRFGDAGLERAVRQEAGVVEQLGAVGAECRPDEALELAVGGGQLAVGAVPEEMEPSEFHGSIPDRRT
jgi:hypothetical protein